MGCEGKADVQPGKAERIEFTAGVFQSGPEHRNDAKSEARRKCDQSGMSQAREEAEPERKDGPQRRGSPAEKVPEKEKLWAEAEPTENDPRAKGRLGGREARELNRSQYITEDRPTAER